MTGTALYRIRGEANRLLYVGITINPPQRMRAHRAEKDWWPDVRRIDVEWHSTRAAALAAERLAIQTEHPQWNVVHAGERPALAVIPAGIVQPPLARWRTARSLRFFAAHPAWAGPDRVAVMVTPGKGWWDLDDTLHELAAGQPVTGVGHRDWAYQTIPGRSLDGHLVFPLARLGAALKEFGPKAHRLVIRELPEVAAA